MRRITVKVSPGVKEAKLFVIDDANCVAHVKAPPVDCKANDALVDLLAAHFVIRKGAITIFAGHTSRTKRVEICDD